MGFRGYLHGSHGFARTEVEYNHRQGTVEQPWGGKLKAPAVLHYTRPGALGKGEIYTASSTRVDTVSCPLTRTTGGRLSVSFRSLLR